LNIGLDATYSVGSDLTGVGVYSREILAGLARLHPEETFRHYYRPHRFRASFDEPLPANCRRRLLIDIVGAPGSHIFHGLNQRQPARRSRRMVATFHDLFVLSGEYSTPEFRARFAEQARWAARTSDLIIAVSSFTASQVASLLGVEGARIRVIPHGARPLADCPERREKLILHVGAIQKRKNIARLIEAFEGCPREWRLILAGGAGYGADEIYNRINESPACDRITITGYISRQRLEEFYRRAGFLAFPSLDEGFGIPVLEAMAAGLPVVTSNRSALPEIAGEAAVLVDPENTEQIRAAMSGLAQDDGLRKQLSRLGRIRSREFTWEAAVEKTWAAYSGLA
jgi:glycosyltransferase involved in cell wall biosynthesis